MRECTAVDCCLSIVCYLPLLLRLSDACKTAMYPLRP
jgi:hypothetical protein